MNSNPYEIGDYKTMSIPEKIDFFHKIHADEISIFDENGDDNGIMWDYFEVYEELITHPELLCLKDLLCIMENFDDDSFELSMQYNSARILSTAIFYYGQTGIPFYVENLLKIPETGRFHGWYFPIRWFLADKKSCPIFKDTLSKQNPETKNRILQFFNTMDFDSEQKQELMQALNYKTD